MQALSSISKTASKALFLQEEDGQALRRKLHSTLLTLGRCDGLSKTLAGIKQEPAYLTFGFRVKDATSGKHLVRLANAANTTWNDLNEISQTSARRGPRWATKNQLRDLTRGASKDLGLPSQVIQEVIDEFNDQRKQAGRPKLRWRVSRGARRSLGWVRFTNQIASGAAKVTLDVSSSMLRTFLDD